MGRDSAIEWCHHTFNTWRGCTKVSPGCAHCYAEAGSRRNPAVLGVWGPKGRRVVASEAKWREVLQWDREARETGDRARVFCASLADVFERWDGPMETAQGVQLWRRRDGEWTTSDHYRDTVALTMTDVRARLFSLIRRTPHLDWLLLTKRPENWSDLLHRVVRETHDGADVWASAWLDGDAPANAWLGASVEDRRHGLPRIEALREIPAAVRFLSIEPLLEDLGSIDLTGIDWVIVGGESGGDARPMDLAWVRSIRDQCAAAGVACFVKQLGARPYDGAGADWMPDVDRKLTYEEATSPAGLVDLAVCIESMVIRTRDKKGGDPAEWPRDLRVREFPRPVAEARS